MSIVAARIADQKGLIPDAIRLYEELVASGDAELIDYLNLIAIYFNCLDFGYVSAVKVGSEIEENCSSRSFELIDEAELKFGFNDELTFWRGYIPFLGLGDEIGEWELRGDSLVPYVYLSRENPTEENIQKAKQLYNDLEKTQESQRRELLMSKLEMLFQDT
jgi:hypothetical protein